MLFFGMGDASGRQHNAEAFAREGYAGNVVACACICKIASSAASLDIQLQRGEKGELVKQHPLLGLLSRPNRVTSRSRNHHRSLAHMIGSGDRPLEDRRLISI